MPARSARVSIQRDSIWSGPARGTAPWLRLAERDVKRPLATSVRARLESNLDHDFSQVRVHSGPGSDAASEILRARAYTVGRDIYLGRDARSLDGPEFNRLLAHEAVHTMQQAPAAVTPDSELEVSAPGTAAEFEASQVADSALAGETVVSSHKVAPLAKSAIQRDITGTYPVKDGTFTADLKDQSAPGGKSGVMGTIRFTADPKAPDSTSIKLLQVARDEDLSTGRDYVWTGGEANRMKAMTAESKKAGVEPGSFVDALYASITPRTAHIQSPVSPYYRTYWPNVGSSQDGSKSGKTVTNASLYDFPGSAGKRRFTFETAAKADDHGYIYATFRWGFTLSDPAKGVVDHEHATAARGPSATFLAAAKQFSEFVRNPLSATAP
jgi:hypothetical protein